jgi:hypothetical protein
MQLQPLWADDLIDNTKCWQTEQRFDTIDIPEQDSSCWVSFPEFCGESCTGQSSL